MGHDCDKQADFGADFEGKCLGGSPPIFRTQICLSGYK